MQIGKVDWSREGRLVLQFGLMDCCVIGVNRLVWWFDASREGRLVLQNGLMDYCDIVNRFVCLMQVGMLDVNREGGFK